MTAVIGDSYAEDGTVQILVTVLPRTLHLLQSP